MNDQNERIESLMSFEFLGERPTLVNARHAAELFKAGVIGRYYMIHWWDNLPSGYTRFLFDLDRQPDTGDGLPVLKMNRYDTAMDVSDTLPGNDLIIMYGVVVPAGDDVYYLPVLSE